LYANDPGATGYIGGQVLHDLLTLKKFDITAMVRDQTRADVLAAEAKVKTVVADLDSPHLAEIASQFDVVLHTANADHAAGARAILAGLEKRAASSPAQKPILIHTSGTGVLLDMQNQDKGNVKGDKIYSDDNLAAYHALPSTQPHKDVDEIVQEAGKRGNIDAIIVAPPTIWGIGEGVFNIHSIQVPYYIKGSVDAGETAVLGQGLNTWSIIHVHDLGAAYIAILEAALAGNIPSNPSDRYYFCEDGEYEQRQVAAEVTRLLYERGKVKNPKPKSLVWKDIAAKIAGDKHNPIGMTGGNSRSRAVLVRKLGWWPKRGGNKEFIESIKGDVDYVLGKHVS
jgi:nucleoside-diphosphate-sugar epimerase